MRALIILTLSAFTISAKANPCYFNTTPLTGKISGVKLAKNARLAIRHHGDGDHINRMFLKTGKMGVEAIYDCTMEQPIECTMSDTPFYLLFDGDNVKLVTKRAKLAVGAIVSDEVELAVVPDAQDHEITLAPAPAKECYKLMPYSDKIETFPEPER